MKIRLDFVTNSSSSSFLICKKILDDDQLYAIRNHSKVGKQLGLEYADESWEIQENKNFITGYTFMDNFYISELFNLIGIKPKSVTWSEMPLNLPETEDLEIEEEEFSEEEWRKIVEELRNNEED